MPLEVSPPRTSRFGSPLVLSRVHWVRPELVTEVKFFTWTDDNLGIYILDITGGRNHISVKELAHDRDFQHYRSDLY